MKTIFRSIFAGVVSLSVLTSAADLRAGAANACGVDHSADHKWNSAFSLSSGEYFFDEAVDLTDEIKIEGNVTICLNGKTITAANDRRIFNIQNGGSLTICDCKGNGVIKDGNVINREGTSGGTTGGAVYVEANCKFILNGGEITNCSAKKGGGVYVNSGGTFIMDGGIISKNDSEEGGGVYVHKNDPDKNITSGGVFTMRGGTIFNNEAVHQGGGVYICGDKNSINNVGEFTMSGGIISENNSEEGGGVYTAGTFTMSDSNSKIFGNTATSTYGGGVSVSGDNAKFIMESGTLSDNKAKNGGGVYVSKQGKFEMNGGTIGAKNEATNNGGGVYMAAGDGEITISGGKISNNESNNNGGGIYVNGGTFTMNSGSVISDNSAAQDGGGAYVTGGNFTMSGSVISGNTAVRDGGGVYLNNGNFTMNNGSKIENNTANRNGSCVFNGGGTMTLDGTVTLTSKPKSDGSKSNVYLASGKTITIGSTFAITKKDIIGIHLELTPNCKNPIPVTTFANGVTPTADIQNKFSADIKGQYILYENNQVKLRGEHDFDMDTWVCDSETHSNTCTICDLEISREKHNFDGGVITKQPTYTEKGEITYTCVDCGWQKTAPIPRKTSNNNGNNNNDNNSQNVVPYDPPTGIAISLAPTALAVLGIAAVIRRKK